MNTLKEWTKMNEEREAERKKERRKKKEDCGERER
jgi:hypothetical protein